MSSIHCTDCPNYDSNNPSECCSNVIRPKAHAVVINGKDKHYHDRADQHAKVMGLFRGLVNAKNRDSYFNHANVGNC